MGGVLPYKWEVYCSTNGRCTAGFPFLQGLEDRKVQRYKWGAYCRTNWRCTAVLSPRPVGVEVSETVTETHGFSRPEVPNSRFAPRFSPSLIHGLCAFFASNSRFFYLFSGPSWHPSRQPLLCHPLSSRFALHGLRALENPNLSRFSGRGWGQQLFSFQSPAVQWMAQTSSLNCLSCRNPYQTPDSLNGLPPFHWKPLFALKSVSTHPLPKNRLWPNLLRLGSLDSSSPFS